MLKTGSLAQDLKARAEKWKSCFAKAGYAEAIGSGSGRGRSVELAVVTGPFFGIPFWLGLVNSPPI